MVSGPYVPRRVPLLYDLVESLTVGTEQIVFETFGEGLVLLLYAYSYKLTAEVYQFVVCFA
jgi:hypothetical protein